MAPKPSKAKIPVRASPTGGHGDGGVHGDGSPAAAPCLQRDASPSSLSPAQTPSPQTPHPVKPPRASITGLSVDLPHPLEVELGGVEAVQQRLREVEKQREEEERKLRGMERHRREEEGKLRELERQRAEKEEDREE